MSDYDNIFPTAATNNTINSISPNIRDALLKRNLPTSYRNLSTSINNSGKIGNVGFDSSLSTDQIKIPVGLPLEDFAIENKNENVKFNRHKNFDDNANELLSIETKIDFSEIDKWPINIPYPRTANENVQKYGIMGNSTLSKARTTNINKNQYIDTPKQFDIADSLHNDKLYTEKLISYNEVYGGNNDRDANIVGSILNGQGVGFSKDGIVPNFDLRSSLVGRVLGSTGIINDTPLGIIGGQQLALALANNAAFNVQQELLGSLNIGENVLSLVKGNGLPDIPKPNYKITVPESILGRILDTSSRILGFTMPRSYLDESGSLFQSENGDVDGITRSNAMLLNTGGGQVKELLRHMSFNMDVGDSVFRSGYVPAFKTKNRANSELTKSNIYAYDQTNVLSSTDGIIPDLNYNKDISKYGFSSPEDLHSGFNEGVNTEFSWGSSEVGMLNTSQSDDYTPITGNKKSLLVKTQQLFNSVGMKTIVSVKGEMNKTSSQFENTNGGGISRGNAVLNKNLFDVNGKYSEKKLTAENTYCRSWTTLDRYDTVKKLVRNHKLWDDKNVLHRFQSEGSVLGDNGFVKIAPYTTDSPTDPKKFMFSIENLAWNDDYPNLPNSERGPGDLMSGKKGRIMWFPPYNIQFSESNTINWETNNFIGRGEPVYTYNNTERSGNLSFQIIVDHPSYINSFRGINGPDDNYVNSFWAGCIDPNSDMANKLSISDMSKAAEITMVNHKLIPNQNEEEIGEFKVYFPNDRSDYNEKYENGLSGSTMDQTINYTLSPDGSGFGLNGKDNKGNQETPGKTAIWGDRYNYGLNLTPITIGGTTVKGFNDLNLFSTMGEHLTQKCPNCVIEITGYASKQGISTNNNVIATNRADKLKKLLIGKLTPYYQKVGLKPDEIEKRFKTISGGEIDLHDGCIKQDTDKNPNPPTDIKPCKVDRYVSIKAVTSADLKAKEEKAKEQERKDNDLPPKPKTTKLFVNERRFYNETNYFDELTSEDKFIFDKFREKIKYFHPAFHSTTPEGLNSRLTFLLQCTRQGRTLESQGATNLAFGRPPVCILRIGDFYNSKIVMDSVNIDYEPLVWDLNPEGIGVQPMIANVSITFKFIGGSTLMGPINKLQNALSFNYFANAHVYDPRADYLSKKKPKIQKYDDNGTKVGDAVEVTGTTAGGYYINNLIDNMYGGNMNIFLNESIEREVIEPTDLKSVGIKPFGVIGLDGKSIPPKEDTGTTQTVLVTGLTEMFNVKVLPTLDTKANIKAELLNQKNNKTKHQLRKENRAKKKNKNNGSVINEIKCISNFKGYYIISFGMHSNGFLDKEKHGNWLKVKEKNKESRDVEVDIRNSKFFEDFVGTNKIEINLRKKNGLVVSNEQAGKFTTSDVKPEIKSNSDSILQEFITFENSDNRKLLTSLLTGHYYLGSVNKNISDNTNVVELIDGQYILKCFYDNKLISSYDIALCNGNIITTLSFPKQ